MTRASFVAVFTRCRSRDGARCSPWHFRVAERCQVVAGTKAASYITGSKWFFRQHEFGALPMIYGTLVVAVVALVLAAPLGFGAAIFIAEYLAKAHAARGESARRAARGRALRRLWAARNSCCCATGFTTLRAFEPLSGDTLLTAGILLAVMILPDGRHAQPTTRCRAVPCRTTPRCARLGLTRAETIWSISLPQARRGIGAAMLLSLWPRPRRNDRRFPRRRPAG